jgi:hypothetical protein
MSAITLTNQGFSATSINPSASHLTRRGRLARTLVVLSLSVLMASGFAMKAGAGSVENPGGPAHFVTVVVAPGESLWTLASALATPDAIISASATKAGAALWTFDRALAKAHPQARLLG